MARNTLPNIASIGDAVDVTTVNAVPILSADVTPALPALPDNTVPDLPPELQPGPGDVLLAQSTWPWSDLGAQFVPESWLYMSRRVQGVIAQLAVQTPQGPKLVKANSDGTIVQQTAPTSQVTTLYQDGLVATPRRIPQLQYAKANLFDVANLSAASTTQLMAGSTTVSLWIKRIRVSSNVAVTNKIKILTAAFAFESCILPPNAQPYDFVFDDAGYESPPNQNINFYTDNAGLFSVTMEYLFGTAS